MYYSSHLFPIHIIYALIFPIIRDSGPRYKWVGKSLICNKQVGFKTLCNKQVGIKALVISKSFSSLLIGCVRRHTPRTDKGSSSITDNTVHSFTQEYHRIPLYYPRIPSEDLWISLKDRETDRIFLFPRTTKNYQNLIKMITMKINGTISWHNSCYLFKKENCAQKQQIIIAWLDIGKLAVFLYFDLYETMNTYYILSFYSKYNFTK
jgi:hypothetical protein